jgi:5-bromo-4-chloroindolyl phosphate hydrolysis protein
MSLKNPFRAGNDLISGVVATAALGGTVFALHLPMLVAAGVAVAVYGGTKLLLGRDGSGSDEADDGLTQQFVTRGRSQVAQLQTIAGTIRTENVRNKVASICISAEQIFRILEADSRKTPLARGFVDYTLDKSRTILSSYRDLSLRPVPAAQQTLQSVESLLDTIDKSFRTQIERLVADDVASLDSEVDVLKTRLEFEGEDYKA